MTWSFSELKRQHGEERALEMLASMKGFGEFGGPVKSEPKPVLTDNCPFCGEKWSSKRRCGREY